MGHEVELKLEIAPEDARRLREQPWVGEADCRTEKQQSTYYDTHGRLLRKSGYSLRVRSAGNRFVQTLKSLDGAAGLFMRGEWEYEVDGPEPDVGRLSQTPAAELQLDSLEAVVKSDVSRTSCRLHQKGSEIELDLDEGTISAGKRQWPVSEVELELRHGAPEEVFALARRIADETPVRLSVMSKAERGFALAAGKLSKPTKAEAVPVQHGMTIAQGLATIVNACLRHFRLNEKLVVEIRTKEALHQVRVAMRRLRSALSLFGPLLRDPESTRLRQELRWFTRELGDARNLDVYLQRELAPDERRMIEDKREAAYDAVIAAMNSGRFRHLVLDLARWVALGEWRTSPMAEEPLEPFVNHRIDRVWSRLSAARHLVRMDDDQRHRLRIQAKKLRYALEFVAVLYTHERDRQKLFGKALEELQEELGLLNDLIVAQTLAPPDEWLVDPRARRRDERMHLHGAAAAIRRMRDVGPYWRG